MSGDLKRVFTILKNDLRKCYFKDGILAGTHHFTDYWARDGFFAALGSIAIEDNKIVEKMVNLYYKYQRPDGLIPYRIMRGPMFSLSKYWGKPPLYSAPRPTYKLRGVGKEVFDGSTLTVLFTAVLGLNGWKDAKKFKTNIVGALGYLEKQEKNNLLNDGVMGELNDLVLKYGNLLYSNIIYWYMFDRLSRWTGSFDKKWSTNLKLKADSVEKAIRRRFWNGKYFADWYDYKRQEYFYPFCNCLAIVWGLTSKKETGLILGQCRKIQIDFTLETNFPKYPWYRIDPLQRLIGMGDYQNKSLLWWQPAAAYLAALKKAGMTKDEKIMLDKIVNKIAKDDTVYECYERNGKPVDRLIYKSENPFAWAAGMLLWAVKL